MKETTSPHAVGSIYIPQDRRKPRETPQFDGMDYDRKFMGELIGTVTSILGIFALMFSLVLFM